MPIIFNSYQAQPVDAPYIVYLAASILGLVLIVILNEKQASLEQHQTVPLQKVINISISTTASVFALFSFPFAAKLIFEVEIASYVALTISCFSIAMLVPRTQANKSMSLLSDDKLTFLSLMKINKGYSKLIWLSCVISLLISAFYLKLLSVPWDIAFAIPSAIMLIFVSSQYGFIYLTSLSLRGKDLVVAKLNIIVLIITLIVLSLLVSKIMNVNTIFWLLPIICMAFIVRNIRAKKIITEITN